MQGVFQRRLAGSTPLLANSATSSRRGLRQQNAAASRWLSPSPVVATLGATGAGTDSLLPAGGAGRVPRNAYMAGRNAGSLPVVKASIASARGPSRTRYPPPEQTVPGTEMAPVRELRLGAMSRLGRRAARAWTRVLSSVKDAVVPAARGTRMCRPPLVEWSVTIRAPHAVSQAIAVATSVSTWPRPPRLASKSNASRVVRPTLLNRGTAASSAGSLSVILARRTLCLDSGSIRRTTRRPAGAISGARALHAAVAVSRAATQVGAATWWSRFGIGPGSVAGDALS